MPVKSKSESLPSRGATGKLSLVANLLCAFAVSPASAASPDIIQPDLLPSSTWGSGPMVPSLAQLIRHEGPIRGEEPKSTANPEASPAMLLARARTGSADHSDQTTPGVARLGALPSPPQPADPVSGTSTTPKPEPVAYALQGLR